MCKDRDLIDIIGTLKDQVTELKEELAEMRARHSESARALSGRISTIAGALRIAQHQQAEQIEIIREQLADVSETLTQEVEYHAYAKAS